MSFPTTLAQSLNVAIVGASLGGLSAANVLYRAGAQVQVFESVPHRFEHRGGALGAVDTALVNYIRGGRRHYRNPRQYGHYYGRLWKFLYEGLPPGNVHFGHDISEIIDADSSQPKLRIGDRVRGFDLIVGADGGKSTVRRYVTAQKPVYAGYTLWRSLLPAAGIRGPSGATWIDGLYYETGGFQFIGAEREPMWNSGVYMPMPSGEVAAPARHRQIVQAANGNLPAWFLPLIRGLFGPDNGQFWQTCIERGKISSHPVWEMAADPVVRNRIVVIGDAAHMASPRTGTGAYTAMLDAVDLGQTIEQSRSLDQALEQYNHSAVTRGRGLLARSRSVGATFVPPEVEIPSPSTLLARVS